MKNFRESILLAQHLVQHLGDDGLDLVRARVDALHLADEPEQARYWSAAAYAMVVMANMPDATALGAPFPLARSPDPDWWLMQRVEAYRHLAWVAEKSRDPNTGEWGATQLDAATGWRELAADLHQLALTSMQ